jgi:hypothetical protein
MSYDAGAVKMSQAMKDQSSFMMPSQNSKLSEQIKQTQDSVFPTRSSAIATQGAFKNLLAGTQGVFYNTAFPV